MPLPRPCLNLRRQVRRRDDAEEPTMIRVMVVDDNDLLRYALRESLYAERGIEIVAECRDGQEAAEHLGGLAPDVVVTDLSMPRLDGVDLTRLIMQRRPATRVLVLTAAPHGRLAEDALAAGASAVLAKGTPLDDLVAAILAAPRRRRRRSRGAVSRSADRP
jgi:DNA-binding NarL/FixJ family response regulator